MLSSASVVEWPAWPGGPENSKDSDLSDHLVSTLKEDDIPGHLRT